MRKQKKSTRIQKPIIGLIMTKKIPKLSMRKKYPRSPLFGCGDMKSYIKKAKSFEHKLLFKIPITREEVENIAYNPYFRSTTIHLYDTPEGRYRNLLNNRIVRSLLID